MNTNPIVEVELTQPWLGHPTGSTHRLVKRMADSLVSRGAAKAKSETKTEETETKMETGKLDKMIRPQRNIRK